MIYDANGNRLYVVVLQTGSHDDAHDHYYLSYRPIEEEEIQSATDEYIARAIDREREFCRLNIRYFNHPCPPIKMNRREFLGEAKYQDYSDEFRRIYDERYEDFPDSIAEKLGLIPLAEDHYTRIDDNEIWQWMWEYDSEFSNYKNEEE